MRTEQEKDLMKHSGVSRDLVFIAYFHVLDKEKEKDAGENWLCLRSWDQAACEGFIFKVC